MFFNKKNQSGVSTIEMLIAFAVVISVMTAVVGVVFGNQSVGIDTETNQEFSVLNQSILEQVRATARTAFNSINNKQTTGMVNGILITENLAVTDISPCAKQVTSSISWVNEIRDQAVRLFTTLTSPEEAIRLGGNCSPFEPGEWDNPDSFGWTENNADIPSATGLAVASVNNSTYVFITTEYSPSPAKHNFWVIDVTNPEGAQAPIASLDLGESLSGITIARNQQNDKLYAYILQKTNVDQLQVIDVTDPSDPKWVTSDTLPNINTTCNPASSPCRAGLSIYYYDEKVYIGTNYLAFGATGTNHELHIYDVSNPSDPLWPRWETSINVDRKVNDIVVRDGVAFLAIGTGGDNTPLRAYDVDPTSATYKNQISSLNTSGSEHGTALYLLGNKLYLGRERAGNNRKDFFILDVEKFLSNSPSNEVILGSMRNEESCAGQPNCGLGPNTAVVGIVVQGKYAFLATTSQTAGFQVWNISDPNNIHQPSRCGSYNYSEKATDIAYTNNYVFVSNETNSKLRIIHNDQFQPCSL